MGELSPQIKDQLSKYVRVFDFGEHLCLLNGLSLDKVFIKADADNQETKDVLQKYNLLKDFDVKAEKFVSGCQSKFDPSFRQLYLVVTEACNFDCKYCRQVTHDVKGNRSMTRDEARLIVDNFFNLAEDKPRGVVFYGGEPLVNKEVMLDAVKYIRQKESKLKLDRPIDMTIITNGTLVDHDSAQVLKDNDVYIIMSIDGRAQEHDKFRVYANGKGTFDDVIKGYKIYQQAGCRVGISCTIGSHNYDNLEDIFDYFANDLQPINVGINLPHDDHDNPLNDDLDFGKFCQRMFKIFEQSTDNNLYIEHIIRKLKLLFRHEIKINDCAACGGRLVALPGQRYGVCEGAIGMDEFFFTDIKRVAEMSAEWYGTSPLFDDHCSNCAAVGVCGGGCPFDGYLEAKQVGHRDSRRCLFMNKIVEWGLENFYKIN